MGYFGLAAQWPAQRRIVGGEAMRTWITMALLVAMSAPGFASKNTTGASCKTLYTIIQRDTLGNVQQGISGRKHLKWLMVSLEKKYPGVCYVGPDPSVKIVFVITVKPSTYHGTRIVSSGGVNSGRVVDDSGNAATYSGTSSSSTAIPYSFDYGKYMLTIETVDENHKFSVRHRFEQNGIYLTLYGIPLGGRGHHPQQALIEDAVKWIYTGGLSDPLQSVQ